MLKTLLTILLLASSAFAQFDVIWERTGSGPQSRYGSDIFSLGDQNGDGFDDFAVEALGWGNIGDPSAPRLELFHGGNPPETEPYMVFQSEPEYNLRIYPGWCIGDFNGDGYRDWFNYYWDEESPSFQSRIYFGGPDADDQADWTQTVELGNSQINYLGSNKSRGFDFNGDSFDDLYFWNSDLRTGEIIYGGANADTIPDWIIHDGAQVQLSLMAGFGDLNGDGYDDMLSENNNPGLKIFLGGADIDTIPSYIVEGVGGG